MAVQMGVSSPLTPYSRYQALAAWHRTFSFREASLVFMTRNQFPNSISGSCITPCQGLPGIRADWRGRSMTGLNCIFLAVEAFPVRLNQNRYSAIAGALAADSIDEWIISPTQFVPRCPNY